MTRRASSTFSGRHRRIFGLEATAGRPEHRQPEGLALGRGRACATPTPPRRSAGSITKRASPRASPPAPTRRRDISIPSSTAGWMSARRCRGPTARPGCTRRRGWPAASIRARWRPIISARSATITSMTARRNGTAKIESFPGFEIDEIAARRFAKVTGEINLPPIRFAEVGTPAFYLSHIRPAVFTGAMATQAPDGQVAPLSRPRRPARPQLHRRAAAADGAVGRRRGRLGRRRLSQDRIARFAEDHVVSARDGSVRASSPGRSRWCRCWC